MNKREVKEEGGEEEGKLLESIIKSIEEFVKENFCNKTPSIN